LVKSDAQGLKALMKYRSIFFVASNKIDLINARPVVQLILLETFVPTSRPLCLFFTHAAIASPLARVETCGTHTHTHAQYKSGRTFI